MGTKLILQNGNGNDITLENPDSNTEARTINIADIHKAIESMQDNIETFRQMLITPDTVYVAGYHAKDDGAFGSHFFKLRAGVAPDGSFDNGGTVIETVNGVYDLQYGGAVNVKWFGAVGDGLDSTQEIKKAISVSSIVYFPEGSYMIKEKLLCRGTIFRGESKSKVNLICDNANDYILNPNSFPIELHDIMFSTTREDQMGVWLGEATGTNGSGSHLWKIINCKFKGFAIAIDTNKSWNGEITNVDIQNCKLGIKLHNATNNVSINNCFFTHNIDSFSVTGKCLGVSINYAEVETNTGSIIIDNEDIAVNILGGYYEVSGDIKVYSKCIFNNTFLNLNIHNVNNIAGNIEYNNCNIYSEQAYDSLSSLSGPDGRSRKGVNLLAEGLPIKGAFNGNLLKATGNFDAFTISALLSNHGYTNYYGGKINKSISSTIVSGLNNKSLKLTKVDDETGISGCYANVSTTESISGAYYYAIVYVEVGAQVWFGSSNTPNKLFINGNDEWLVLNVYLPGPVHPLFIGMNLNSTENGKSIYIDSVGVSSGGVDYSNTYRDYNKELAIDAFRLSAEAFAFSNIESTGEIHTYGPSITFRSINTNGTSVRTMGASKDYTSPEDGYSPIRDVFGNYLYMNDGGADGFIFGWGNNKNVDYEKFLTINNNFSSSMTMFN